jgi:hypothetical protein
MAVEDAEIIKWCNEDIRRICDTAGQALGHAGKILVDVRPDARDYLARLQALDPAEPIADGAPADGRAAITVGHVLAVIRVAQVLSDMADDDRDPATGEHTGVTTRGLIHRVAVNVG